MIIKVLIVHWFSILSFNLVTRGLVGCQYNKLFVEDLT